MVDNERNDVRGRCLENHSFKGALSANFTLGNGKRCNARHVEQGERKEAKCAWNAEQSAYCGSECRTAFSKKNAECAYHGFLCGKTGDECSAQTPVVEPERLEDWRYERTDDGEQAL